MRTELVWIDSRIQSPTPNHFDCYIVAFKCGESVFVGLADWQPVNNYTYGFWTNTRCTNGNGIEGEVLYWMPHPARPKFETVRVG